MMEHVDVRCITEAFLGEATEYTAQTASLNAKVPTIGSSTVFFLFISFGNQFFY